MATKRRLQFNRPKEAPRPEREEGFPTWSKRVLARYWFVVASIFIDALVPLDVAGWKNIPFAFALACIVLLLLIAAEAFVYWRLWGTEGAWRYEEWE